MHLGLIGGIGPAATEFYYRGLVRRHAAADRRMELTIVHAQIADLARNQGAGAAEAQAAVFADLVGRLKAAGAEAAAVTSLGGHFCIQELEEISPLPMVNLVRELDAAITDRKLGRVGLLGTRLVMETGVYDGLSTASFVSPAGEERDAVHEAYIAMAFAGDATDSQRDLFFTAGEKLVREQGAEAVVLAGTDLFLAFDGHDCGFPVIDSAEVHINALYDVSILET